MEREFDVWELFDGELSDIGVYTEEQLEVMQQAALESEIDELMAHEEVK